MKTQLNNAKLDQTKLEAEFSKLKEQCQQLDITSTKLTNQCEVRRHTLFLLDLCVLGQNRLPFYVSYL